MKQCYKTKKSSQKELILALYDTKWGIPENVLQGTLFITQGWAQHWNVPHYLRKKPTNSLLKLLMALVTFAAKRCCSRIKVLLQKAIFHRRRRHKMEPFLARDLWYDSRFALRHASKKDGMLMWNSISRSSFLYIYISTALFICQENHEWNRLSTNWHFNSIAKYFVKWIR